MTIDPRFVFSFFGYGLVFAVLAFAISGRWFKQRRLKAPMEFKLLRGPGESLRRRLDKFEDQFAFRMLAAALAPLVAAALVLAMFFMQLPIPQRTLWIGVFLSVAVFLAGFIAALRWMAGNLRRYRSDRLGYLGEREVAEHLQTLCARGYVVFHDVPASSKRRFFNIDHVAVGPAGVVVIETKTRRKVRSRTGRKEHIVSSDGRRLIWPWGEDQSNLKQAASRAEWVREWIRERTGIETPVRPILALPGWFVETTARGAVAVVNPKLLPAEVERGATPAGELSREQIDAIVVLLDDRCRDVVD